MDYGGKVAFTVEYSGEMLLRILEMYCADNRVEIVQNWKPGGGVTFEFKKNERKTLHSYK